uniref:Uncharacterized protein n=1 Tax=Aotus nancymaae TaxID=37293 RepID=A0A2K5D2L5_AOTNA
MKLLTHNLLSSHASEVSICPVKFNPQFVALTIPKAEWAAFLEATDNLRLIQVPNGLVEGYEENEEFLRTMHHLLPEVEGMEGTLRCPESAMFPIIRGIPNMPLSEEETKN